MWSRGRNNIFRFTLGMFVLFQIGCALAPNVASLVVFRFFSGFFGSPTVTNSGGSITDIWPQNNRSVPLALFSAASFLGPVIAPTVGGFISQYTYWRWNFWVVLIFSETIYVAMVLFLPETYPPKLLRDKARRRQGPDAMPSTVKEQLYTNLTRPWIMLFTEQSSSCCHYTWHSSMAFSTWTSPHILWFTRNLVTGPLESPAYPF